MHGALNDLLRHPCQHPRRIDQVLRASGAKVERQMLHRHPVIHFCQIPQIAIDRVVEVGDIDVALHRGRLFDFAQTGLQGPPIIARCQVNFGPLQVTGTTGILGKYAGRHPQRAQQHEHGRQNPRRKG